MKKKIEITGMHCKHCAQAVEQALLALEGVKKAKADHEKCYAIITLSGNTPDEAIRVAVEGAGFTAGAITEKKGLFE